MPMSSISLKRTEYLVRMAVRVYEGEQRTHSKLSVLCSGVGYRRRKAKWAAIIDPDRQRSLISPMISVLLKSFHPPPLPPPPPPPRHPPVPEATSVSPPDVFIGQPVRNDRWPSAAAHQSPKAAAPTTPPVSQGAIKFSKWVKQYRMG